MREGIERWALQCCVLREVGNLAVGGRVFGVEGGEKLSGG